MAEKATAGARRTVAKKAAVRTRKTKGDSLSCEVCGLSVVVETVGNLAISRESALLCCGTPMKTKVSKATPASKTTASKATPTSKTTASKAKTARK